MKQGIHLGVPRRTMPWFSVVLVSLGSIAALILGAAFLAARLELAKLREELAQEERGALAARSEPLSEEGARELAWRLRAVLDSGAADSISPAGLLRLVTAALPDEVVLSSVGIDASPPERGLTLEAEAPGAERISELQRRVAASPGVRHTSLLEERRLPGGGIAVRMVIELQEDQEGPERKDR